MGQNRKRSEQLLNYAKGSHTSTYLTLISIVQGVAFSFLSFFVSTHYNDFNFVGWLLSLITLIVIVMTWNEYVMAVISFLWIPDFLDALIPFILGASEIFIVQSLSNEPEIWFLAMAVFSFFGFIAFANMYVKAKKEQTDNHATFEALGRYVIISILYPIVAVGVFMAFWLIVRMFSPSRLLFEILSVLSALSVAGFLIRVWLYWKAFVSYVRIRS